MVFIVLLLACHAVRWTRCSYVLGHEENKGEDNDADGIDDQQKHAADHAMSHILAAPVVDRMAILCP